MCIQRHPSVVQCFPPVTSKCSAESNPETWTQPHLRPPDAFSGLIVSAKCICAPQIPQLVERELASPSPRTPGFGVEFSPKKIPGYAIAFREQSKLLQRVPLQRKGWVTLVERELEVTEERNGPSGLRDDDDDDECMIYMINMTFYVGKKAMWTWKTSWFACCVALKRLTTRNSLRKTCVLVLFTCCISHCAK